MDINQNQRITTIQMMTFEEVCSLLRKSRSGLYKLIAKDTSFPKPVKDGEARQSRTFFADAEISAWQEARLAGWPSNT